MEGTLELVLSCRPSLTAEEMEAWREINNYASASQLGATQDPGLLPPKALRALSLFFHEYALSFACLPTSKPLKTQPWKKEIIFTETRASDFTI